MIIAREIKDVGLYSVDATRRYGILFFFDGDGKVIMQGARWLLAAALCAKEADLYSQVLHLR